MARTYPVLGENALIKRNVGDAAPVTMSQCLRRTVASSHTDSLGKDLFELWSRAASYQRPYQCQSVVIEVRLQHDISSSHTAPEPLRR